MTDKLQIEDVSDTSFWVAYYRAKENERPDAMFRDPFAKTLVGDKGREVAESMGGISRFTEWSVLARTVIIDRYIERLVKEGVDAVINLGAGLDARPYRMNLPAELLWIEADYPNIILHKTELLKAQTPKCQLVRVAVDLADPIRRKEFLKNAAPGAKRVLVLTEGVIPYLSPEQVADLSKDLLAEPRITYWITEYFNSRVYRYLKDTTRELKLQKAPFKFYPEDWFAFFKEIGWTAKETKYTGEIAAEFRRQPPMPRFVQLIWPLLPKKVKEQSAKMVGYVVFEPTRNKN